MLRDGKTIGVFQLESPAQREMAGRLLPHSFDDLIVTLSLVRPGPLKTSMDKVYLARRHGREPVSYMHPNLEGALGETLGVILYQEQVMEIARAVSGFSMAEADNLRKAMGKKKPELLEEQRDKFIEGAAKEKVSRKAAEEIFELIKTFGRYGFNKSHSTAYALLAFQTAYLKVHYPVHYLAALLSGELHDTDKIAQYIQVNAWVQWV
jgi:DNA polymerase-3 subunit alpha